MAAQDYPASSTAAVGTDRPHRYGKQLAAHLGRRYGGEWDPEAGSGWVELQGGQARIVAEEGVLRLQVGAVDEEALGRLEEVVGSHLARFGERDELSVAWDRDSPTL